MIVGIILHDSLSAYYMDAAMIRRKRCHVPGLGVSCLVEFYLNIGVDGHVFSGRVAGGASKIPITGDCGGVLLSRPLRRNK